MELLLQTMAWVAVSAFMILFLLPYIRQKWWLYKTKQVMRRVKSETKDKETKKKLQEIIDGLDNYVDEE